MFDHDIHDIFLRDRSLLTEAQWAELADASNRGGHAVRRWAKSVRASLTDEVADEIGARLASLLADAFTSPDRSAALFAATFELAGPRTVALVGATLREELGAESWAIAAGLELLAGLRTEESAIQLRLCAREAFEIDVLLGANRAYRGWTAAMLGLLYVGRADAPLDDLARYFAYNLEDAMLHGTKFSGAELKGAAREKGREPLARVIWAAYSGRRVERTFRLDLETNTFVDGACEEVVLSDVQHIGVPHPAEFDRADLERWGMELADFEIVTLFPQLDRPTETPQAELPYRLVEHTVDHGGLVRFLAANGWHERHDRNAWVFATRGARLTLAVDLDGAEVLMKELSYKSTLADDDTVFHAIAYSESLAAMVCLLEQFAPDLL